jgi:hypothetical protein
MKNNKPWKLLAKALGDKSGWDEQSSDQIALIRLSIVLVYVITNLFIIAGVVHHW